MPGDEKLAGEQFSLALLDLEVNMWGRPARVGDWLDGSETVGALRSSGESSEPLEVLILLGSLAAAVACVEVNGICVALPDFDDRIGNRLSARAQHAAGQVRDLAHGGSDRLANND